MLPNVRRKKTFSGVRRRKREVEGVRGHLLEEEGVRGITRKSCGLPTPGYSKEA